MWLFVLSGLLAWTGKPTTASCPIRMDPPRVVVRFGDPLTVNCSSLSDQTEGMGWESSYGGTGLKVGATFLTLKIDSVRDWDFQPICYMSVIDGEQCSVTLPVTVYKPPDSVSMPLLTHLAEDDVYSTPCNVVNVAPKRNLSVSWHKGNEIFRTQTFSGSNLSPVNISTFTASQIALGEDHGRQVWCEAKLNFWPPVPNIPTVRSERRELFILYPPKFTKPANETLEVSAGSKMVLDCNATGNPTPTYSWHFPHAIQRTKKSQHESAPVLTPSFQLPGTYSCTALNSRGSKTKYFTVMEATRDRTVFAALVGGFLALGVLLFIAGVLFVTDDGTFSFSKSNYLRGRPTSSGPV